MPLVFNIFHKHEITCRFRIASLNLKGARDVKKRNLLYEVLKTKQIALAFTQETHSSKDIEVEWQREWGGQVVFSRFSSSSGGVAILFSSSFLPISFDYEEVVRGRLLKVTAKYEKKHDSVFKYLLTSFAEG